MSAYNNNNKLHLLYTNKLPWNLWLDDRWKLNSRLIVMFVFRAFLRDASATVMEFRSNDGSPGGLAESIAQVGR